MCLFSAHAHNTSGQPLALTRVRPVCAVMDDADCPDAISEDPVESETTEQPGPSGLSILEALKAPRLSELTRERQNSSLQDYIEASLMLQYNNH